MESRIDHLEEQVRAFAAALERAQERLATEKERVRKATEATTPESMLPQPERDLLVGLGFKFKFKNKGTMVVCTEGDLRIYCEELPERARWCVEYCGDEGHEITTDVYDTLHAALGMLSLDLHSEIGRMSHALMLLGSLGVS